MALRDLKMRMLKLLREDEEFRYAVAGLIGLEEILKRLDRNESELVKLREDMVEGFKRHDAEIIKLREDMNKLREDMNRLREDMNRGFEFVERHISALGSRWGIMAESAFRESLRGILEKELGLKVKKWRTYDEAGRVYGYPTVIDIDVVVRDGKTILVEVSSHIRKSDVFIFKKKSELYWEKTGAKPERLLIVTPYIDEEAVEALQKLGIEVYTRI
ncbi:MAG: DUF3782 domain-containing protein [Thaumarchaeota archaeon]|nr:DUF3782 domain-containing protein [Candidatus Geocrenenecus arthurdayi]